MELSPFGCFVWEEILLMAFKCFIFSCNLHSKDAVLLKMHFLVFKVFKLFMNEYFLSWKDVEWQQLQAEYYAKQANSVPQCLIIY